MITLTTPVESVPRIPKRILPAFKRLGVKTIRDLLLHFPARYDDFSNEKKIRDIKTGETVTIRGTILKISFGRTARKHMHITEALIGDETGSLRAVWFNQPFLARNLKAGDAVQLSGKTVLRANGIFLQNPAYEKLPKAKKGVRESSPIHTGGLVAVYPETEGISSRWLRFLMRSFVGLAENSSDPLPAGIKAAYDLPGFAQAVRAIHFPDSRVHAESAERRFILETLILMQLRSLRDRSLLKQHSAPAIALDIARIKEFIGSLPFTLTNAQRRSLWEIATDMARPHPMNRLLEGDVGSGKTVVAAAASLLVVSAGRTVALMAPTEILARQHYATIQRVLAPFHVSIALLVGSEKRAGAKPDADITVGTHALIHKKARLENLGLVIVDEQHRFGVEQRAALLRQETEDRRQEKSTGENPPLVAGHMSLVPHFLSMTATPIPRTLALTAYGDLDLSLLDEMPRSRKEVITKVISPKERKNAYAFIRDEAKAGRQIFVICPRIEQAINDMGQATQNTQQKLLLAEAKTVKEEYHKLSSDIFPDLRIAMLHGRMKAKEKEVVMRAFHDGAIDILVSTSVVEVGVDVPNASIMMIEGAELFGLAQLHQFRGRVGRGENQSYCFLFPGENGETTRRLEAVVKVKNGFELAEYDLAIRGPGDIFGNRQWGVNKIVLQGISNPRLVREAREIAIDLVRQSPNLSAFPLLARRLQELDQSAHLE